MILKIYKGILTTSILLFFLFNQASAQLNPKTVHDIQLLLQEKESRTPAQKKMDSRLLQAAREKKGQKMVEGVDLERADVNAQSDGRVKVDISADVTEELLNKIRAGGGEIIFSSKEYHSVRALINLSTAETIAGYKEVKLIEPAALARTHGTGDPKKSKKDLAKMPIMVTPVKGIKGMARPRLSLVERKHRIENAVKKYLQEKNEYNPLVMNSGVANSEGDHSHRADDTRNRWGYAGQGIKIGVLSDSYNYLGGAAADVLNDDLPGTGNPFGNTTPVTVVADYLVSGAEDEGRAMLQIVHDIAPKAQLFFATGNTSEASFASNIVALRNTYGCDIIIDDLGYYDEPVFQDGMVAQAVNTVTAAGALYFSSAGNEGALALGTAGVWEGDFNDTGSPAFTGGTKTGTIHNFGSTPANGDSILAYGSPYNLQWSDAYGASNNDYDLFLVTAAGTVRSSSTTVQSGTQNPYEQISTSALTIGDRLVVFKSASAAFRAISLNTNRGTLKIATSGQTHGHSAAVDAYSVAAIPATGVPFVSTNTVESFTSDGLRRIFYTANGTAITPGNLLFSTNGGTVRNKPDITAADGVSTTLPSSTGLNPFFGTSAAAPHAGAIAALIKSASPSMTPAQIRTLLTSTALDIQSPGYDNISGNGVLQAFNAMQSINPNGLPYINLGTTTFTESTYSNGNGSLEPGETGNLVVQLKNSSLVSAAGITATVTTITSGVTITQGSSNYNTIASGTNASNTATPFMFAVNSSVPCGTVITFLIKITFSGGVGTVGYSLTTTVGTLQSIANISSTLGGTAPAGAGYTVTSGQQTGRLVRGSATSTCAVPVANPGLTVTTGARQYDAYTFTNTTGVSKCFTATMSSSNGGNLYTAAYNSSGFVPTNPSTNYIAEPGQSAVTQTYSFTVAAGAAFTVVVHDVNETPASNSPYTLSVTYIACASAPACTPVIITTSSIASGATGANYVQHFAATGGSGSYIYSVTGTLPSGLSVAGDSLSGTPMQSGNFPITVTASDVTGCPAGTKNFTLVIAPGNTINYVSAGSGNWSNPATWTPNGIPSFIDNVTINNSHTVTIDTAANCNNLTVGGGTSGTLIYESATARSLTLYNGLTVAAGGNFNAGAGTLLTHTLIVGGNSAFASSGSITNNGILDLNTTAGVTVTFAGAQDGAVSGTGSVNDFYAITVNKGTTQTGATLDVVTPITMSVVSASEARLVLNAGTFKLSSASNITPIGGDQTICSTTARLWLNNAGAVYNAGAAGSPAVSGELRIDAGTFNYGLGNNTMTFTSGSGVLRMSGGTLNMNGAVAFPTSAATQLIMSGGAINVDPQVGTTFLAATTPVFSIGALTSVDWSGGTITVIDPHNASGGVAWTATTGGTKTITGGTLRLGNGTSTTAGAATGNTAGFGFFSSMPVYNLTIDNRTDGSATRMVRLSSTTSSIIANTLTLNSNGYLFLGSGTTASTLTVRGNVIQNGILAGCEPGGTVAIGTMYINGLSGSQTFSGSGTFVNNATISLDNSGSSGITFSNSNPYKINRVNLFDGVINPGSNLIVGNSSAIAGEIPVVQYGGNGATLPSGIFTSFPSLDETDGPRSLLYSSATNSFTLGFNGEIGTGTPIVTTLLIGNNTGLNIPASIASLNINGTLSMTLGNINLNGNSIILGTSAASPGTLTYTAGLIQGGGLTRWFATTGLPTTPGTAIGFYPVGSGGNNRNVSVYGSAQFTTGGTITVNHTNVYGLTTGLSLSDAGAYTVNNQTKSYWTLATGGGLAGGSTIGLRASAGGLFNSSTPANLRLMQAASFPGTHAAGSGAVPTFLVLRTALSVSDISSKNYYIGGSSADLTQVFNSIVSGNWSNGATWETGTAPASSDVAYINSGHNVTVDGANVAGILNINSGGTLTAAANSLTVTGGSATGITNAGTLNLSGSTITLGTAGGGNRRLLNSGTLTVSGGTLNINGSFSTAAGGTFNQSSGNINVDGNAAGVIANSVASGTALVQFSPTALTNINLTGGTFTIVDPHASTTASDAFNLTTSAVGTVVASPNHTFRLGNGVSADAGGNATGFQYNPYASTGGMKWGNVEINGPAGTNRNVTLPSTFAPLFTSGNLTINNGGDLRQSNTAATGAIAVGGNLAVNAGGSLTTQGSVVMGMGTYTSSTVVTFSAATDAQTITNAGTIQNLAASATANFTALQTFNTNASGVTFAPGLIPSLSGALTVSDGLLKADGISFNGTSTQTATLTAATSNLNAGNFIANNSVTLAGLGKANVTGTLSFGAANSKTLTTAGLLILKSTPLGTARIADITNAGVNTGNAISGNVTVERYIPARRAWRLMTAPLSNTNTIFQAWQNSGINTAGIGTFITGPSGGNGLDNGNTYSLKTFDVASQALVNVANTNATLSSTAGSAANTGYFMFVRGDRSPANLTPPNTNITTLSSIGSLQTGTQTFTASSAAGKFTLIGNPYASPVDFSLLTRTNVVKRFYAWDPALNTVGGYVTVDDATNTGTYSVAPASSQTSILQSSQAFFVPTQVAGAASVTFNETSKSAVSTAAGFRTNNGSNEILRTSLYLKNSDTAILADGVLAEYNNNFSKEVNFEDAPKFGNINENLSMTRDGQQLSIERRPLVDLNDTLFLNLTNTSDRNYSFKFEPSNISAVVSAWLEDSYLKTSTPLSVTASTSVDFSVAAGTASADANRFRIVFKTSGALPISAINVKAYQQNGGIQVDWNVATESNMSRYEVEKSADGQTFAKAGAAAAMGNNNAAASYNWFDATPLSGSNFYRIKAIGKSGEISYSQIVNVKVGAGKSDIVVYPNPVHDKVITLQLSNQPKGTYIVQLFNGLGQQLLSKTIEHAGGSATQTIQLGSLVSKGVYQLQVSNGDNKVNQQIIVQ